MTKLRVCASCEWVFQSNNPDCPKCEFGSYGARYVYGKKAYRFFVTQKPWLEKKLFSYEMTLRAEIRSSQEAVEEEVYE